MENRGFCFTFTFLGVFSTCYKEIKLTLDNICFLESHYHHAKYLLITMWSCLYISIIYYSCFMPPPVSSFEEEWSFLNEQLENNSNVKKISFPFLILQVFNEDTRSLEISQSYTITQREFSDYSVPCKKRKIELGWDVIKDHLQKSQNDFELVPW